MSLFSPLASSAGASYEIQCVVRVGDAVGGRSLLRLGNVQGLNETGQILFGAEAAGKRNLLALYGAGTSTPVYQWSQSFGNGWQNVAPAVGVSRPVLTFGPCEKGQVFVYEPTERVTLQQFADDHLTPITLPQERSGGFLGFVHFVGWPLVNRDADAVVYSYDLASSPGGLSLHRWDFASQELSPLNLKGRAAADGSVVEWVQAVAGFNDHDALLFVGIVKDPFGRTRQGILLLSSNSDLVSVALEGQALGDGRHLGSVIEGARLTNAGRVLFQTAQEGKDPRVLHLWDGGTFALIAEEGQTVPGGGQIADLGPAWAHDDSGTVLIRARLAKPGVESLLPNAVFLSVEGTLLPVALPGQEMPGGGRLPTQSRSLTDPHWLSPPNDQGQHLFIAELEGGSKAVYRIDADGTLALVLKQGTVTTYGTIGRIGTSAGFNNKGQIALTAEFDSQDSLLLLTPATP